MKRKSYVGENNPNWKGGISKDRDHVNKMKRLRYKKRCIKKWNGKNTNWHANRKLGGVKDFVKDIAMMKNIDYVVESWH